MKPVVFAPAPAGPVSAKVLTGLITGAAAWLLNYVATVYVWPHGMPPSAKQLIGGLAMAIGFGLGGYAAKHRVTAKELEEAVRYAESVTHALGKPGGVRMSLSASVDPPGQPKP